MLYVQGHTSSHILTTSCFGACVSERAPREHCIIKPYNQTHTVLTISNYTCAVEAALWDHG